MKTFRSVGVFVVALAVGASGLMAGVSGLNLALSVSGQGASKIPGQNSQSTNPNQTNCEFNHGRLVKCGSFEPFTPSVEQGLGGTTESRAKARTDGRCEFNHGRLVKCGSTEQAAVRGTEQGLGGRTERQVAPLSRGHCEFNHGRLVKCPSGVETR